MPDYDSDYKQLFSHPRMVQELLCDWVPGPWTDADFSTLEHVNGSYVSETQKQRHDDVVWRLRMKDRWLWVYLILEFQSEPDPWMALRMLVYVGLLAQDLVKNEELSEDGKLPPILPLVLYNGHPPWNAPTDVANLFTPAPREFDPYLPHLTYYLIDEARLMLDSTGSIRSAVEALFRLERSRTPDDMREVVLTLAARLRDPQHETMRRNFTAWIKRLLRRKTTSSTIGEIEHINDLLENDTMLAERIDTWFNEAEHKGIQIGLQQGIQQGLAEGEARGEARGLVEGKSQLLRRQLERRFGLLPPAVSKRLAHATPTELEIWGDTVLTAPTLDAVFVSLH